jgi:AcrR family transcriptional regulator
MSKPFSHTARRDDAAPSGAEPERARARPLAVRATPLRPAAVRPVASPRRSAATTPAEPARPTQAQRRETAESRLLQAALQIVARRGTVGMTLAEVGEAAGYSRGLPAHHFGSKAGLVRALCALIRGTFRDDLQAAPARAPGLDALRGNIEVYFGRGRRRRTTTRALLAMMTEAFMGVPGLRQEMTAYNRIAVDAFAQDIRDAIAVGEVRADVDPRGTAVLVLGAMRGAMQQWLVDESIDLVAVRDLLLAAVDRLLPPVVPGVAVVPGRPAGAPHARRQTPRTPR